MKCLKIKIPVSRSDNGVTVISNDDLFEYKTRLKQAVEYLQTCKKAKTKEEAVEIGTRNAGNILADMIEFFGV